MSGSKVTSFKMDMNAFWCIVLSILVIRHHLKHRNPKPKKQDKIAQSDPQTQRDIADLKRQGYSDELIAVILPTLMNDR